MKLLFRLLISSAAAAFALLAYIYVTLPDVRVLARTNLTRTAWMEMRAREGTKRHEHR